MDDVLVQSEVHEPEGDYTPAPYPPDSASFPVPTYGLVRSTSTGEDLEARQLFFPRPIPPSFSVLARACLWYLGARI